MKVAIVGAGVISDSHLQAYQQLGQAVSIVVDVEESRAQRAAEKYAIPSVQADWRILLDREEVDVVDICTPPKFHREIAVAALQAGKHVVCEKPLAGSVADADAIVEAAESSTGKLLVVHQMRCQPFYRRLQWLLNEGHLGEIHFARVQRYDPPPRQLVERGVWGNWELSGGGVLMTKAIHQLDMLLGLLGPVNRVQALMGTYVNNIESEDHITANVEFRCGAIANVCVCGQPYGGFGQHFDLLGEAAALGQPWHIQFRDGRDASSLLEELETRFPIDGAAPTSGWKYLVRRVGWKMGRDFFAAKPVNTHAPLFREFFDSIQSGGPLPVTPDDGRRAVELCTAIYASALTQQTIELPLADSNRFYRGIVKDDYASANACV